MYSNDNGIERIAVVVAEQTSIITQNASCVGGGGLFTREAQSELVTIKKTPYLCSGPLAKSCMPFSGRVHHSTKPKDAQLAGRQTGSFITCMTSSKSYVVQKLFERNLGI